jgi:predicted transcriptional regulator
MRACGTARFTLAIRTRADEIYASAFVRYELFDSLSRCSYSQNMQVQLSSEQEAQLSRIAKQVGREVEDLAREAVDRYLTEEEQFRASVQAGRDAAARGDFVSAPELWSKVEHELRS